jgi:hypothetical protein
MKARAAALSTQTQLAQSLVPALAAFAASATAMALTLLVAAPLASASSQPPMVEGLDVQGSGCPDPSGVTASLTDKGDGQFVYGLVLADLDAATVLPGTDIVVEDCAVNVRVTPPHGYKLRISAVMLQGRHDAPAHVTTAKVTSRYSMSFDDGDSTPEMQVKIQTNKPLHEQDMDGNGDGNGMRVVRADGIGTSLGNWTVAVETRDMHWSPCGETITLDGVLTALASSENGTTDAEQVVQRSDVTASQGLAWGWQLERCDAHDDFGFEGRWSSRYKALGGQMVHARVDIHGDSGTYTTSSFVGHLHDLETIDGALHGRWSALGSEGWIRFTLDHDGRGFRGVYGLGHDEHSTWSWSGQR